jgi:Domain of unknown function (DUF4402)
MRGVFIPLLIVFAAAAPSSLQAQCRLCDKPTTALEPAAANGDDIQIEVEAGVNFDRLILARGGDGTAVIRPDGSRTATGSLSDVGARAMVATVVVRGQPNRAVRVELPTRIELLSLSGARIAFDQVESDLPSAPRLDSAGNLRFRFGGRLRVTGDAEGDYRGDLPVTVEYL